jgi:hypothetical protein
VYALLLSFQRQCVHRQEDTCGVVAWWSNVLKPSVPYKTRSSIGGASRNMGMAVKELVVAARLSSAWRSVLRGQQRRYWCTTSERQGSPRRAKEQCMGPPKTQRLLGLGDLYSYMGRQKGNQSIETQSDDEDNVSRNLLLRSIFSVWGFPPFPKEKEM